MSAAAIIVIIRPRPPNSTEEAEDPAEYGPALYGPNSIDAARQHLADILSQNAEP